MQFYQPIVFKILMKYLFLSFLFLSIVFMKFADGQTVKTLKSFKVKEAKQGVAVDDKYFYVINNSSITKHDKKTGELISRYDGSTKGLKHLNSGKVYKGKLYCAHSNFPEIPMVSSIEIFDTKTMQHVGSRSLGISTHGSLNWLDRKGGHWYMGFAHYSRENPEAKDNRWTTIVQYDDKWQQEEAWVFPKHIIEAFGTFSNSGAVVGNDDYFYCTGHDEEELYVLKKPTLGYTLEYVRTIKVPIQGQGIAVEGLTKDKSTFWGIRRSENSVVALEVDQTE